MLFQIVHLVVHAYGFTNPTILKPMKGNFKHQWQCMLTSDTHSCILGLSATESRSFHQSLDDGTTYLLSLLQNQQYKIKLYRRF